MEERDWEILLKLYEEKNITKAAEALFVSQPALTSRLQYIEERFKSQIVIRGKKGVCFTPEGEYLVGCARDMLQKMHFIEGTIQTLKNEVKGTLKIGASVLFIRHSLPEILKQFSVTYPSVEFKISTNLSNKVMELVHSNELDVGFVRGDYEWGGIQELLFEEKMYIVSRQEIKLEDLPDIPRVDYKGNRSMRNSLAKWWKEAYLKPPLVGVEVDKVDSCKELVLNGLGYAFLPDGILDDNDDVHKILMLDKMGNPLLRRTWMCYKQDNMKIALTKTFVDFVKTYRHKYS